MLLYIALHYITCTLTSLIFSSNMDSFLVAIDSRWSVTPIDALCISAIPASCCAVCASFFHVLLRLASSRSSNLFSFLPKNHIIYLIYTYLL